MRQGSHDSTCEWLIIEWETKKSCTCSVPPPPTHTHTHYSSCLIRLISSDGSLLRAYKSPPAHKATYSCLGGNEDWWWGGLGVFMALTMTLDLDGLYRSDAPAAVER